MFYATIGLIVATIFAILLIIVIFQNIETVDTKILFFNIRMPRALLLMVTLLIGFVVGVMFGGKWSKSGKK